MDIIIQLIGGMGIIASIISFQCKKHNSILFFRTLNEAIFALQFFLLGAYTGMTMNLIGCVRNIIFTKHLSCNLLSLCTSRHHNRSKYTSNNHVSLSGKCCSKSNCEIKIATWYPHIQTENDLLIRQLHDDDLNDVLCIANIQNGNTLEVI